MDIKYYFPEHVLKTVAQSVNLMQLSNIFNNVKVLHNTLEENLDNSQDELLEPAVKVINNCNTQVIITIREIERNLIEFFEYQSKLVRLIEYTDLPEEIKSFISSQKDDDLYHFWKYTYKDLDDNLNEFKTRCKKTDTLFDKLMLTGKTESYGDIRLALSIAARHGINPNDDLINSPDFTDVGILNTLKWSEFKDLVIDCTEYSHFKFLYYRKISNIVQEQKQVIQSKLNEMRESLTKLTPKEISVNCMLATQYTAERLTSLGVFCTEEILMFNRIVHDLISLIGKIKCKIDFEEMISL